MAANTGQNDHVTILTDSQSLVTRLQLVSVKSTLIASLDKIKGAFRIAYIPVHAGISYNELADHLPGIAVPIRVIKFHPQDIINRLKESSKCNTQPSKTVWSLQKLQEIGIKFGVGGSPVYSWFCHEISNTGSYGGCHA